MARWAERCKASRGQRWCDFRKQIGYTAHMPKIAKRLSSKEIAARRERRLEAMHLQVIEGNPLDAEDIEMFEREGWDDERCIAYILEQACVELATPPPTDADRAPGS